MRTSIVKRFEFSYAHILPSHPKCSRLHGHNAVMDVEVSGDVASADPKSPGDGMLIDFGALKSIVNTAVVDRWDHRFLARGDEWVYQEGVAYVNKSPSSELTQSFDVSDQLVLLEVRTTAENLAKVAYDLIEKKLEKWDSKPTGLRLESVSFWETPTSCAVYRKVR